MPPLPQTKIAEFAMPAHCRKLTVCTLGTMPLPDPSILKRIIVSTSGTGDTHLDVSARVTVLTPGVTL